jgi:Fe-S cluster biogenesis protein NfuA
VVVQQTNNSSIPTEKKVQSALDEIRPFLQSDGGDIELVFYKKGVVKIKFLGYCAACSKSLMTLNGVSEIIKKYAPEVVEVIE